MNTEYPYLPEGRTIKYVSETDIFMAEAKRARNELSTELSHSTGAVVVLDSKIIGIAGNQAPLKNKKLQEFHRRGLCVRKLLHIPSGQKYWLCPGCAQYKNHAEASAIEHALSGTSSIQGADVYLYGHWWCCKPCWDSMVGAGIKNVFLVEDATKLFKK